MSCSRTQHGGGRSRTPDLSLRSPTLYHWATALPSQIGILDWNRQSQFIMLNNMSRSMTKPTKWHVRPARTQISLGIRPVWSESSLSAWRNLRSLATHWTHSEDSDQTGQMPRKILIRLGWCPGWSESLLSAKTILLVLSCCDSYCSYHQRKDACYTAPFTSIFIYIPINRGPYTSGHFIWNLWNEPSAGFINFIWNAHECKILFIILDLSTE